MILKSITIQEIKSQLSITTILTHYGSKCINKSSGSWWCPIHEVGGKQAGHKTPSLVAKDITGTATCLSRGCFESDDIFGIIAKMENIDVRNNFTEIKKKACEIAGIYTENNSKDNNKKNDNFIEQNPKPLENLQQKHLDYLHTLKISPETAHFFDLKARYDYILYPQKNINTMAINGYKGISITKDSETGKSKMFFEGEKVSVWGDVHHTTNKHIIFTEGEKDCIRLTEEIRNLKRESDYAVITITTGAKTIPSDIVEIVNQLNPKEISIIYDNDETGYKGSRKLANALVGNDEEGLYNNANTSNNYNEKITVYHFNTDNKEGYDITDFLNEGGRFHDIWNLEKEVFIKQKQTLTNTQFFSDSKISFSMGELKSNPPEIKWLIEDFLAEGRLGAVIATGSTGKSWFLLQLAISVSSGIDFMGMKNPNNEASVLYIIGEENKDDIHRRVSLVKNLYNKESQNIELSNNNLSFLCVNGKHAILNEKSTLYSELKLFIHIRKPKLIILDPLIRFFSGDENNSTEMTRFMEILESLNNMGTTVLFAHHTSKILSGELSQHSARGSTAVIDAVRWNITLHKISEREAEKYKFEDTNENLEPSFSDLYINAEIVKCNSFRPKHQKFTFKRSKYGALEKSSRLILK